jgi:hypothetical protein
MTVARSGKNGSLVMARNLEPKAFNVALEYKNRGPKVRIPEQGTFELPSYTVKLLPVNVKIPGTKITVEYSTSELLNCMQIGGKTHLFVYGNSGTPGETVLVREDGARKKFKYTHSGVKTHRDGGIRLVVLDKEHSGRLWDVFGGACVSTFDLVEDGKALIRAGIEHDNSFYLPEKPEKVSIGGRAVTSKWDAANKICSFKYKVPADISKVCKVKWEENWHYRGDTAEAAPDFDDSEWQVLPEPVSLEKAGIFGHGWFWYRSEFELDKADSSTAELEFDSGMMDRMYVYINGNFIWKGIGKSGKNVAQYLKPGKNVIAVRYENAFHTKAHPHEGATKKYSGLLKPFILKDAYGSVLQLKKFKVKYNLNGVNSGYHTKLYDDSSWKKAPAGEKFLADESLGNLFWMRRKFSYNKEEGWQAPLKLTIPRAEERCMIYLNGQALGKFESLGPQNDFYIPETMLEKDNLLAIVVEGPGFHNVLQGGYNPAFIEEPVMSVFYAAKETELKVEFKKK